ncbi:hypothetical protein GCK72_013261 [Caenorhabditis remanei]|uniref:Uncharacterized protein n=1 Tax=Caenorhabditis remanei TaxID=31234 RepID=A0A6A5GNI6_CAERE|nr:hypothetical protein GCK72_013261 [Caenorhabditis remanei]KAF1756807.1 hypothetical protein GCK72_013261 [Caenorhabditis remanei]
MPPLWILLLVFSVFSVLGEEEFNEKINMKLDVTCSVRPDWCFNITIFTVKVVKKLPVDIYPKVKTILQKSFCSKTALSSQLFEDVSVVSPFKNGFRANYQLSHTCSSDGKPDCVVLDSPYFITFGKEFKFAPHKIGVLAGRGECKE